MKLVNVFIGDSVTDCGRDVQPPYGDGYVNDIATCGKLPGRIINVGASGHRLVDLEGRWEKDVIDYSPTLVSVAIGINDTWRRYDDNDPTSVVDFETRYRRILNLTRERCNPAFVLCEPFLLPVRAEMSLWREDLDPKIEVVHKLANEFDAVLVEFDARFTSESKEIPMSELAEDGIHPTPYGHSLMAKIWLESVGL